jgi:hypothetical protein
MVQAAEMIFLKSVKGCTRLDMRRRGEIREDLDIFAIQGNSAEKVSYKT